MNPISQLNAARNLLCTAFDNYLTICTSINKFHAYADISQDSLLELMDCVSNELALAHDLGKALLKARATLASIRNRAPCIVPISRLPDDVLIQIFEQVAAEKSCHAQGEGSRVIRCPQPLLLTHVCSRWRQVAKASRHLWIHIDVSSYLSCNEMAIARAKECIGRAGNCPLDIHIVEPDIDTHSAPTPADLSPFSELLAPITSQIRTLDVRLGKPLRSLQCPESGAKRYSPILSTLFKHSTAGALKRLSISLDNTLAGFTSQHYFMEASGGSEGPHSTFQPAKGNVASISTSQQELEDLLHSVTALDLKGFYPRWASKAYSGLVELRLTAYSGVSIPETDLRVILSSSPRLRHLDLGIKITRRSPSDDRNTPLLLEDLETLVTGQRSLEELGSLLRMIRPGSHPLSVSLDKSGRCSSHPDIPRVPFGSPIQEFFARANVEALNITGTYNYSQVAELLELVPRARVLGLSGLCLGNINSNACTGFSSAAPRLSDLYLLCGAKVAQHFLVWLVRAHQVRRVVISEDSKVTQGEVDSPGATLENQSLDGCAFEYVPSGGDYPMKLWI